MRCAGSTCSGSSAVAPGSGRHRPFTVEVLDVGRKQTRDIGQPRLVLLASSNESLQSFTRGDTFPTDKGPYGVFTSFVLHAMMHLEAPVSADDVYQHASKGMEIFFGEAE